jgi:transposase
MLETSPSVSEIVCQIREINYCLPMAACDRCQQPAAFFTTARRMAIDLHLEHPVLLHLSVSVHYCPGCHHYFRAQPPFVRPDAIYTNRVVDRVVQSVYQDGMAMRRVAVRMARDFWVQPSEAIIRQWCQEYSAGFDFETDYQPWVVNEFSGVLCVDEVYQDRLALLLAVDPAAPDGDRLVGYQLIHGSVDTGDVEGFLQHLKRAGIEPDQVVTDGSKLYPTVLPRVWPQAAHQLCLFHATRHVTQAAMKAINAIRKALPHGPPKPGKRESGPLRSHPPSDDSSHPAAQRWYWRQLRRRSRIAQVHALADQGLSQRAIARQTGHHRDSIRRWLQQPVPALPEGLPAELSELASLPLPLQRQESKPRLICRVHDLAHEGLSYSAIARQVGIHRVTVKKYLQQEPPKGIVELPTQPVAEDVSVLPPEPWSTWDEVRQVREALNEHRFLLLRRPENLNQEERAQLDSLFESPLGLHLQVVRSFLVDWYSLWNDEDGEPRSLADARTRYQAWQSNPAYRAVPQLRRLLDRMTDAKFDHLSQFLRHPGWETTNNGAERTGRAFRHRQAPHYNLRTKEHIENAINVVACLRKEAALGAPSQPFHTCQRGRRRRQIVTASPMELLPRAINEHAILPTQRIVA